MKYILRIKISYSWSKNRGGIGRRVFCGATTGINADYNGQKPVLQIADTEVEKPFLFKRTKQYRDEGM